MDGQRIAGAGGVLKVGVGVGGIEGGGMEKGGPVPLTVHRLFFLFVAFAFCAFCFVLGFVLFCLFFVFIPSPSGTAHRRT